MIRWGVLCTGLVLSGCGDARDPFLGMFEGNAQRAASRSGGAVTVRHYTDQVHVAPSRDGERLYLSQLCGLPATVSSGEELAIESVVCNLSVEVEGLTCDENWSVSGGTATLQGVRLTLEYNAVRIASCPTGAFSESVTTTLDATRK